MNITLYLGISKLPGHYKEALEEYKKRLSRYCRFQYQLCPPGKGEKKLKQTKGLHCLLTCEPSTVSSVDLSDLIKSYANYGTSDLTYYIGVKPPFDCEQTLSISALDFSVPLSGVVLSEQIYRAYRILNHQAYHK